MNFLLPVIAKTLSLLICKSLWFIRNSDMSLEVILNKAKNKNMLSRSTVNMFDKIFQHMVLYVSSGSLAGTVL